MKVAMAANWRKNCVLDILKRRGWEIEKTGDNVFVVTRQETIAIMFGDEFDEVRPFTNDKGEQDIMFQFPLF